MDNEIALDFVEAEVKPEPKPERKFVPKPKPPNVMAMVVDFRRGNVLLEYQVDGKLKRCWLPEEMAGEAGVRQKCDLSQDALESGAPYGDDLAAVLKLRCPSPAECQDFFRRSNLWHYKDLLATRLPRLLQALYQADAATVQGRIREQLKK